MVCDCMLRFRFVQPIQFSCSSSHRTTSGVANLCYGTTGSTRECMVYGFGHQASKDLEPRLEITQTNGDVTTVTEER